MSPCHAMAMRRVEKWKTLAARGIHNLVAPAMFAPSASSSFLCAPHATDVTGRPGRHAIGGTGERYASFAHVTKTICLNSIPSFSFLLPISHTKPHETPRPRSLKVHPPSANILRDDARSRPNRDAHPPTTRFQKSLQTRPQLPLPLAVGQASSSFVQRLCIEVTSHRNFSPRHS